jgi:hypothetical protein
MRIRRLVMSATVLAFMALGGPVSAAPTDTDEPCGGDSNPCCIIHEHSVSKCSMVMCSSDPLVCDVVGLAWSLVP